MLTLRHCQNVFRKIRHKSKAVLYGLLCLTFFLSSPAISEQVTVQNAEEPSQFLNYLRHEKVDLMTAYSQNKLVLEPTNYNALLKKIKESQALLSLVHARIASLENFLVTERKSQKVLALKLKKTTVMPNSPTFQSQMMALQGLIETNNNNINLIVENLTIAHQYEAALEANNIQLESWKIKHIGIQRYAKLQHDIDGLNAERIALIAHNVQLQEAVKDNLDFNQSYENSLSLQLNNQNITLINDKISEVELQIRLIRLDNLLFKQKNVKAILSSIDLYKEALEELAHIKQSLSSLKNVLKEEEHFNLNDVTKQRIVSLDKKASDFLNQIVEREKNLAKDLDMRQQVLKQQLSARQTLGASQENTWLGIKNEFMRIPQKLALYGSSLTLKLSEGYARLSWFPKVTLWLMLGGCLLASAIINRKLKKVTQDKMRFKLAGQLYDGLLILLSNNIWQICAFLIFLLPCMWSQIPASSYQLLVDLFAVWFAFRNIILITRFINVGTRPSQNGKETKLFYHLKWLLVLGQWTTFVMVLSKQLPLSLFIQDILTRLFMLFIFAASIFMWAGKDIFPILVRPLIKTKKRYLKNAISLLFILLPITLFTTAVFGLVGYMNLAWSMSRYQANLVIVMVVYVLARGLASDALEFFSDWMFANLRNGWLWVEVFLNPFDKLLRILLLLISVLFLFQLFGIYTEMPVFLWLKKLGAYELVNVSGVHITLNSVVEFFIVLSVFVWATKWTREFCYRWLYRNARDEGIRNSLSVFTQYAVILLGGYITLRVLGLDFSGMSMILGGLAVGMGFGLRDFASNIVGGIMLLIERPVREGDLITLGGHEGRVAHIGIRSMRVSSWDNTEVLIPNAETFNKPFINWTHQDSVVRTVVPIKVSREDDPTLVQSLIYEVLAIIPEIMEDPPAQVFLKHIDNALIEFEVRYFINIQIHTRFEIRSKFLFALTAQFKATGIKPPIPPMVVEIKDAEDKPTNVKNAPEE